MSETLRASWRRLDSMELLRGSWSTRCGPRCRRRTTATMDAPKKVLHPSRGTFVSTGEEVSMGSPSASELDDRWAETLDRLTAFVAARVGDRETAADITQDVIVRSIASGALEHVDDPAAWLYRSARNAVIDHYRTRRAHVPVDELDAWPDPEIDD